MISRRALLGAFSAVVASAAVRPAASASAKVLRVGCQKGEAIVLAAKQNHALEQHLGPLGVQVQWSEFEYGPPLLEAMRVGSIDIGGVGDTPPIFAQAARGNLRYVASLPSGASAILVPPGSRLRTLKDLRGKRIAFARGSSAHNLTVVALEKAGISYSDVQAVYLAPADAAAAFERGNVDAWTVWDPYYAIYETSPGVRVLEKSSNITPQFSYFMARQDFVESNPAIIAATVEEWGRVGAWAAAHRPEVAKLVSAATGVPEPALLTALQRNPLKVLPMSDENARSQQGEADRFYKLGIIPIEIDVRKEIWRINA
jgi:NitT/TauT family transport system substrate-binding protein/sulfonate transport system substrate-binding protein